MNIGCLFGTFDPPHKGHVSIASFVRDQAGLDEAWLVVTPQNPFKQDQHLSPDEMRSEMVRLAIGTRPRLVASDAELSTPRPSYTVDTLASVRHRWPQDRFVLIMGSDNLAAFHRWKEPEEILRHHRVLVYPRPGVQMHLTEAVFADHPQVTLIEAPLMDLSSTKIRQAVAEGRNVDQWLEPSVRDYIREKGLYAM